jgi:hypothetical protein
MPITNREQYPSEVFFSEHDFLEIGTRSNGEKIIQIGAEGDAPLVALARTTSPNQEDLHAIELSSLMKFSQDPNEFRFYKQPKPVLFPVKIKRAFYIKLGRGGQWEESSIQEGIVRIGWSSVPVQLINENDWLSIKQIIQSKTSNRGAATADFNALRTFCTATSSDIWVTFHSSKLWWCRLADEPVEEDKISKFRRVSVGWSDINAIGRKLLISEISGRLSKVQGYRATLCKIDEKLVLEHLLNGEVSQAYQQCQVAREALERVLVDAIQQLHWKDFETLVDLIFRQAGWRRISVLGETMKFADLELEEPITGDRYQVQIKSKSNIAELMTYVEKFPKGEFRRFYFVIHSPDPALESVALHNIPNVELVLPNRLARMVIDSGLVQWLMNKIR